MVRGIFFFTISTSIFTEIFTIFPYDFDIAPPMGVRVPLAGAWVFGMGVYQAELLRGFCGPCEGFESLRVAVMRVRCRPDCPFVHRRYGKNEIFIRITVYFFWVILPG